MDYQNDEQDDPNTNAQVEEFPEDGLEVADLREQNEVSGNQRSDEHVNVAFEETNTAPAFKRTARQRARNLVQRFFGLPQ